MARRMAPARSLFSTIASPPVFESDVIHRCLQRFASEKLWNHRAKTSTFESQDAYGVYSDPGAGQEIAGSPRIDRKRLAEKVLCRVQCEGKAF